MFILQLKEQSINKIFKQNNTESRTQNFIENNSFNFTYEKLKTFCNYYSRG